ncbi:MAG: lyase family protein [Patescibacteria group bacterium]
MSPLKFRNNIKEKIMTLNLSLPGNFRYQPQELVEIFGYDYLFGPVGEVELATIETLFDIGVISRADYNLLSSDIRTLVLNISTSQVDEIERKITKHDIRAWVKLAQGICDKTLGRWIHVPLTSYDPLDTARILQFSRAYQKVLRPKIGEVGGILVSLVEKYAHTLQIGRTHGQHALPITVGFWLANILHRLIYIAMKMEECADQLVGKISGAVGAHNAQVGLGIAEKCGEISFEKRVLIKLGLKPAPISSQILPPEPLSYFLFSCTMLSGTLGQFGRDARHLMRTEIAEIGEPFEVGQVGSSTMAHKRNPINFENLEGMWLRTKNEFNKVLETLSSDHQRDLVGSSLMRDFPIIVINLTQQLNTLLKKNKAGQRFLERLTVNEAACQKNFTLSANVILAEPIYLALQMYGYLGDAHKLVNERAMPISQAKSIPLIQAIEEIAEQDPEVESVLSKIPVEFRELFNHPENYTGDAAVKALEIVQIAKDKLSRF